MSPDSLPLFLNCSFLYACRLFPLKSTLPKIEIMSALQKFSRFIGKTFALWAALFAVGGFFMPENIQTGRAVHPLAVGHRHVRHGADALPCRLQNPRPTPQSRVARRGSTVLDYAFHSLCFIAGIEPAAGSGYRRGIGRFLSRRHRIQCDDLSGPRQCGPVGPLLR